MNILVFSWRDPKHPLAGGAEQVMHEHMKGWIRAGYRVTIFSAVFKNCKREEVLDGVKIIRSGRQYLDVHIRGFLWYLFGRHEKFDLVVDQFHGIPFFTPLYVRVKKLAVIQETAREVWFVNYLPRPFNWIIGAVGYVGEPPVFLLYKNVPFLTGSQSAKEDLMKFGISEKNITIIPHGVLVKLPKPFPKKEAKNTVVFLGAIQKDKGAEDAVRTFYLLNRQGSFQFWVIGTGKIEYIDYLKKLCKKLKVDQRVKFWGFVSQREKFRLLAKAHVLINPSLREGWGLVNIEANAVGVPVVAYKSPGLIDSVRHNQSGIIIEKNTPDEMSKAVMEIVNNSSLYGRLSKGSKLWSQNFTWVKSIPLSLQLINSLFSDH